MKKIGVKQKLVVFLVGFFLLFGAFALISKSLTIKNNRVVFATRHRVEKPIRSGNFEVVESTVKWDANRTAVIIIDMWDRHWCFGAAARVAEMALAVNSFIAVARARGMLIIHAPSETMAYYQNDPARQRAKNAPKASNLPEGIDSWCYAINERERLAKFPIDDSDGGCDTDYIKRDEKVWKHEIASIKIADGDIVSDSGTEIWNLLEERRIRNVLIVGVHTNMCIVGRPFGLRNMARFGKKVMLVRDLTDAMYNPAMPPHVDHFSGIRRVIEHIEKYICPTTTSTSLTGKPAFRFKGDTRAG